MNNSGSVYVVEDDEIVREEITIFFARNGYRVADFPSADAFLARFSPDAPLDARGVVITDLRLPGRSGLDLLRILRRHNGTGATRLPVILLSGHATVPLAVEAMQCGAVTLLEKPVAPQRLLRSVEEAFEAMAAADAQAVACARKRLETLTPREREVLGSFVACGSNKAVARALGMSPRTVEVHRGRIMRKSGATSVPDLVRLAIAAGLVEPDGIATT